MPLTQLPPLDPSSPTFRADVDTFFRSRMQAFVSEANALAANLNSIAAGGAFSLPYIFRSNNNLVGGIDGGNFAYHPVTDGLILDTKIAGVPIGPMLATFGASSSAVKGSIRLQKVGDPSKWVTYYTGGCTISENGRYALLEIVALAGASAGTSANFIDGDAVMLFFQRTGDKGDKGDAGVVPVYPYAEFTEQHASGVSANGGATATNQYTRNLNTTVSNNIPGLSLSGGILTIQAGTYEFEAQACAVDNSSSQNRSLFHNITDNTHIVGMGAVLTGSTRNAFSTVGGRFTISSTKTYKLVTDIGPVGTSPGQPLARGFVEIYAQLKLWKLA